MTELLQDWLDAFQGGGVASGHDHLARLVHQIQGNLIKYSPNGGGIRK